MILKMIEDGKISAEEGMRLLESLKEDEKAQEEEQQESASAGSQHREEPLPPPFTEGASGWDRRAEEKMTSFASRFSEFVDDAVKRVKDADFDWNFGPSQRIEHVFQHKDVLLREVDLHIENGSIELRPWEENDIRIECQVQVYRVRDEETARREFLQDAQFSFSNGKLQLESRKKSMKVNTIVYFPTNDVDRVQLYTFNGKISGDNLPVHYLKAKAVNGKISLDQVDAKEAHIETFNGPIHVRRLNSLDGTLKTMNGTINVDAGRGNIHAESVNGTVHFRLAEASQSKAYVKTTTGSIHIAVPEGVKTEADIKTTVGAIHAQLPNLSIIEEKKDFANKRMTFLANKQGDGHFYIEAEAATGSVHIK